ncbi:phage recombination protein Bet [Deinococcus hopiensis]|uniref:Phage recombination protein Bet n=1 Tax=Deinococcus hopiensis KR-140 TaxID=695939 RepID=A0A1W1V6V3_9DEIO|nr:phage recombination protein Bet [Deinococcus hopiensis]SMB89138.1 phage recombination protein Bet [Deinococcus hopiensis KR-140]
MTALEYARPESMPLVQHSDYNREQIALIRNMLAPETNDQEFQLYMEVARALGLSPLQRQIHAVMRWDAASKRKKMVIQTGIDGYRLIAARTGAHVGTTDAVYGPTNKDGYPAWAQVTVKKLVHGHIAEYPATAFWDEYVQTTKENKPNSMWASRPKGQLSKCAEALALRKAFPAELSGVYTDTEMEQADSPAPAAAAPAPQTRRADITREVAEQAGVPAKTLPDPHQEEALKAWASKIGDLAARVRKVSPADDVQHILETYEWRTSIDGARACYDNLKELGLKHAQPAQQPQEAAPAQPAEVTLSDAQRKALCAHANRANAKTSDDRAALWGYVLNAGQPLGTKSLTEQQASVLLDTFSAWSNEEAARALTEAWGVFPPVEEDLPF